MWAYKLKNANKLRAEWWYSGLTWYNLWNWAEPCELRKGKLACKEGPTQQEHRGHSWLPDPTFTDLWLKSCPCGCDALILLEKPNFPMHSATVDSSILARMDMRLCLLPTAPVWRWREYPFIPQSISALNDKLLDNPTYDQGITLMYTSLLPLSGTESPQIPQEDVACAFTTDSLKFLGLLLIKDLLL